MNEMTHLRIAARREGFRRCGRSWTAAPQVVARSEFSAGQLERLDAAAADPAVDPMLDVAHCGPEGPQVAAPAAGAPGVARISPGATVPELREALIQAAIDQLEPGNDDHFTGSGLPEIAALRDITGLASISADERTAAWERHRRAPQL